MKKIHLFLIAIVLIFSFSAITNADYTEKVRVIKFDTKNHDLIIERSDGERLLIQHNRQCGSMSTEFPVFLIWEGDKMTKLKVASNEICKIYNYGPYSDDITITQRIKDPNFLVSDHLAEIEWSGKKYEIDYGDGCKYLKDFIGEIAYISTEGNSLNNATLYLPRNRGECTVNSDEYVEDVEIPETVVESPIQNISYKAENNEVVFYWSDPADDVKWVYLISRSRYEIDPDDYHWRQMPFLRYSRTNTYTAKTLANDKTYYFYLSARDEDGNVAPWQKLEITPTQTTVAFHNNPDVEGFEIELAERTDDNFVLSWPNKSEDSRKYMIQFFVDGKRQYLKIIDSSYDGWEIPIEPEYQGKSFRFELRSLSRERFGQKYSDGIYWEDEIEN
ncbi:hypothetical protein KKF86_04120 [bacterium]|nr:hypothetical protein [bacterium]